MSSTWQCDPLEVSVTIVFKRAMELKKNSSVRHFLYLCIGLFIRCSYKWLLWCDERYENIRGSFHVHKSVDRQKGDIDGPCTYDQAEYELLMMLLLMLSFFRCIVFL